MAKKTKKIAAVKKKTRKKRGSKKKAVTKRGKAKTPGLEKRFFSRIKQEYHDIDYIDKLDDKERKWLDTFMTEDLGANFSHKGRKLYKTKRDRKAAFDRNNARNRDIYGIAKATGRTYDVEEPTIDESQEDVYENYEDQLIEVIDAKKTLK